MRKPKAAAQFDVFIRDFVAEGLRKATVKVARARVTLQAAILHEEELQAAIAAEAKKTTSEDAV